MPSFLPTLLLALAVLPPPAEKVAVLAAGDLKEPFAIDWDATGTAAIAEMGGNRISLLDRNGTLSVLAGTGEKGLSGDGGPAAKAQFNGPHHLLYGAGGDLYVADTFNNCVRKIDPKTGTVTRVAGTGKKGFSGEGGPAVNADFGGCFCLAFDPKGEKLYVCDLDSRRIRAVVLKTGITVTVAGNGQKGVPKDGEDATSQPLVDPRAVAADAKGNVYILERGGHALRKVDPAGKIHTVAGTGKAGLSGDGGPALQAQMNGPKHLSCDKEGNVLIADTETHTIRLYTPKDGKIRRIAGTGKKGLGAPGEAPDQVALNRPHGATTDPAGAIVICDSDNNRVLRIEK
ncbi:MAG: hypothetical protein JO332_09005 [Planctomycetaceae bacterium]|nr:hypothetical protein [Planctomycetaceae bacterium]